MVKEIDFSGKCNRRVNIGVAQWDYGLTLSIKGIKAAEAHFAINESADDAVVVPLETAENEALTAAVPDQLLAQSENINVYLYDEDGTSGNTIAMIVIGIEARPKPEDYIYTPEERKRFEVLDQELSGIKANVDTVRSDLQKQQGIIADFVFTRENRTAISIANLVYFSGGNDVYARVLPEDYGYIDSFDEESGGVILSNNGVSRYLKIYRGNPDIRTQKSPLLTGLSEFTISYDCKSTGGFMRAWLCYIAPHDAAQSLNTCDYIGIMDYPKYVQLDRAASTLPMDTYTTAEGIYSGWHHVDMVFRAHGTEVYVNGRYLHTMYNTLDPADLLKGDSVFYIGKANWGAGEYYDGIIKTFRVYNRALTEEEIIRNYEMNTIATMSDEGE